MISAESIRWWLLSKCILLSYWSFCQTISGYVREIGSDEPVIGALVQIEGSSFVTGKRGYFLLSASLSGQQKFRVNHVAYVPLSISLEVKGDTSIVVLMKELVYQLDSISVVAPGVDDLPNSHTLEISSIKQMPTVLGEVDVMRAFQYLPGVQGGREGTSGLYVRGGSPDQNLILLDDVPLYYVNHIGGFFSTFDPNAIKSANLIKGGFPARYGGRLSSIMDVTLKEGDKKEHHSVLDFGLLSTRYSHEGPIKKDTSSFLFSVRRANLDLYSGIASMISSDGRFRAGYTFYDINTKFHRKLSTKDQLYVSFYHGFDTNFSRNRDASGDSLLYKSTSLVKWGNSLGAVKWSHMFSDQWISTTSVSVSNFKYQILSEASRKNQDTKKLVEFNNSEFNSSILDLTVKIDNDWYYSPGANLRTGLSVTKHGFNPGSFRREQKLINQNVTSSERIPDPISVIKTALYVDHESLFLDDNLMIQGGLHLASFMLQNHTYHSLQPRLLAIYHLNPTWQVNTTVARMTQFLHLLSNSGAGVPVDLWVPATDQIEPQSAMTYSVGLGMIKSNWNWSLDVYRKDMSDLIEFKDGASFFSLDGDWQQNVEVAGNGRALGLEVGLEKNWRYSKVALSYTLAKNERQFSYIDDGQFYPYRYDRRHNLNVIFSHNFSASKNLTATWQFSSGEAITLATQQYDVRTFGLNEEDKLGFFTFQAHHYPSRNSFRLPSYHRLDIGYNIIQNKRRSIRTTRIGVYNLYNRQNPYYVFFDKDDKGNIGLYKASLFPIIPSISWTYEFK